MTAKPLLALGVLRSHRCELALQQSSEDGDRGGRCSIDLAYRSVGNQRPRTGINSARTAGFRFSLTHSRLTAAAYTMSLQSDTASEKAHIEHKESLAQSIDHETQDVDPAFAKRTLRKIDLRLIPILAALYCVSLIDRTNISVCAALYALWRKKRFRDASRFCGGVHLPQADRPLPLAVLALPAWLST